MKRLLLTFFVILYLGNSAGLAMHFHYCMDKLVEANLILNHSDLEGCGMDGEDEEKNNCCKDEVKTSKSDQDRLSAESSLKLMQSWAAFVPLVSYEAPVYFKDPAHTTDFPVSNAPPDKGIPVYLRNCVFII